MCAFALFLSRVRRALRWLGQLAILRGRHLLPQLRQARLHRRSAIPVLKEEELVAVHRAVRVHARQIHLAEKTNVRGHLRVVLIAVDLEGQDAILEGAARGTDYRAVPIVEVDVRRVAQTDRDVLVAAGALLTCL